MLQAVLVFQLAVGMQLPMAHASVLLGHEAVSVDAEPCPEHASLEPASQAPTVGAVHAEGSSARHRESPFKTHDCCRSVGCQCHCMYTPSICRVTVVGVVTASAHLLPSAVARVTAARLDQIFRPPIA
jgi:hypothetical protein